MPYIKQVDRDRMALTIDDLAFLLQGKPAGHVNFAITKLLKRICPKPNYQDIRNMIGELECIKLELYRKIAAPYEDEKEEENGSI